MKFLNSKRARGTKKVRGSESKRVGETLVNSSIVQFVLRTYRDVKSPYRTRRKVENTIDWANPSATPIAGLVDVVFHETTQTDTETTQDNN